MNIEEALIRFHNLTLLETAHRDTAMDELAYYVIKAALSSADSEAQDQQWAVEATVNAKLLKGWASQGDDALEDVVVVHPKKSFAIVSTLKAKYDGVCRVNSNHAIRMYSTIGCLVDPDNPMLPIQGYACNACVNSLPRQDKYHG